MRNIIGLVTLVCLSASSCKKEKLSEIVFSQRMDTSLITLSAWRISMSGFQNSSPAMRASYLVDFYPDGKLFVLNPVTQTGSSDNWTLSNDSIYFNNMGYSEHVKGWKITKLEEKEFWISHNDNYYHTTYEIRFRKN